MNNNFKNTPFEVRVIAEYPIELRSPIGRENIRIVFSLDIIDFKKGIVIARVGNLVADYLKSLKTWHVPIKQNPYYFTFTDVAGITVTEDGKPFNALISEAYMVPELLEGIKKVTDPYLNTEKGRNQISEGLMIAGKFVIINLLARATELPEA